MTDKSVFDSLNTSMDLSEEKRHAFESDYEIRLSPQAVFVAKAALEAKATDGVTPDAEELAGTLLTEFRQQTVDSNTVEVSGAEWYHIYGSIFTLTFSPDREASAAEIRNATDEIREELPEEIRDIMERVEEHMEQFLTREGDA